MEYLKNVFNAVSAVVGTWIVLGVIAILRTRSKATGIAVVRAGAIESLFSPLFWILVVSLFLLLFAASRANNLPVRIVLYWFPATAIWTTSLAFLALFGYVWMHFRRG